MFITQARKIQRTITVFLLSEEFIIIFMLLNRTVCNTRSTTSPSALVHVRGETIRVNAILRIVFECIAMYCHIAIFDWILVKRYFMWEYGVLAVKKRIYTLYNCIKTQVYNPGV